MELECRALPFIKSSPLGVLSILCITFLFLFPCTYFYTLYINLQWFFSFKIKSYTFTCTIIFHEYAYVVLRLVKIDDY